MVNTSVRLGLSSLMITVMLRSMVRSGTLARLSVFEKES